METFSAKATAHPNIALIKYWGNRDNHLNIPANGSISMNLGKLETSTHIVFNPDYSSDQLTINGKPTEGMALERMSRFLDRVRRLAKKDFHAMVMSTSNYSADAGLASSAAAYAALALAASQALGLDLPEVELSRLARRGSGSACRSIPPGFVEWLPGETDLDSYAVSIAAPEHWKLSDCIAIIQNKPKNVPSYEGHLLAQTSPIQPARVQDAPRRLDICRQAILKRDFEALAQVVELDSNLMHAVMMTSTPPLYYWEPASLDVMRIIPSWRKQGIPSCFTLDAGANVHVLCPTDQSDHVSGLLKSIPGVKEVLKTIPGGGALLFE
jgi:diphosphomevalonate decarboxylase